MHFIPRRVPVEFLQPECASIRGRRAVLATFVAMPEAAVNEDDGFVFRQDDVRRYPFWIPDSFRRGAGFWIGGGGATAIGNLKFEI